MQHKIFRADPRLKAFEKDFDLRRDLYQQKLDTLLQPGQTLADFASDFLHFPVHKRRHFFKFFCRADFTAGFKFSVFIS